MLLAWPHHVEGFLMFCALGFIGLRLWKALPYALGFRVSGVEGASLCFSVSVSAQLSGGEGCTISTTPA